LIAGRKGALASTEPSISTAVSAVPSADCRGSARVRKSPRPGQALPRSASTESSSVTWKGGKAPGKLAVARAAKVSSAGSASGPDPARRNERISRCSCSITSAGELSRSRSG
jgi:hypothetical protein